MSESENTTNGWKWTALVLILLLVSLLTCLCGALFGGLMGFAMGKRSSAGMQDQLPYYYLPEGPEFEAPFEWEEPDSWDWEEQEEGLPWLGVVFAITVEGAEVSQVIEGSPAEEVGLEVGDVITEVEGKRVTENRTLLDLVLEYAPGDQIELAVLHDGKEKTITVILGARPSTDPFMMEEFFPTVVPPSYGG